VILVQEGGGGGSKGKDLYGDLKEIKSKGGTYKKTGCPHINTNDL